MQTQLTVRVPKNLNRDVSSVAKRLGLKRSDIVRMALQRFVDEIQNEKPARPYEKVRDLIGTVASGIPDLGSEHRKHLLRLFKRA